jgi:elongation factor P
MNNDLHLILKAEYNKGGRNAAVMKMKMKNLANGSVSETVYKANDRFDQVSLDNKEMQFLYEQDGAYAFMDQESFDQIDLTKEDLGDAVNYLKEQMIIKVSMYEGRPVGVELPIAVELEITYTEPGNKGDSSGRVLKPATLETGYQLGVPLFCENGEIIRVDTRNGEYMERVR